MQWISKNVDKVIAFAAALVLLGISISIALAAIGFQERAEFVEVEPALTGEAPKSRDIAPMDLAAIQRAEAALKEPATWALRDIPLFKAQSYIVKREEGREELVKVDITGDIHDPITNEYILKYNLAIDDGRLKSRDFDQDGFTVLEEFLAGTNPVDPESHPPFWLKIRMKQYNEIPFRIQFTSRSGETIFVETLDVANSPTQFLRVEDDVQGTNYRVKELMVKTEPHPDLGFDVDVSEVVFEEKATGRTITARVGEIANDPDSFVVLYSLLDDKEFELKRGDTFALPQQPDLSYKVIDMSETKTVIENVNSQEQLDIARQ